METLEFQFAAPTAVPPATPVLCGVVGSGNLEILIEPGAAADACSISIQTSARGFAAVWQAVLDDFVAQHDVGGTRIRIQDLGATPAVVSLRLGQALADYAAGGA